MQCHLIWFTKFMLAKKSLSCQSKPPYKCSLENMYPILKDMGEITSFVFEDKKLDFHINKKGKIYRLIVLTR